MAQQQPTFDTQASSNNTVLRTDNIVKRFGQFTAIDNVSLSVTEGEFRSVIGPNGAGKTTLFNLISGALSPTDGSIYLNGNNITDLPPERRVDRGLARSFQITNIFPGLSVRENVRLAAQSNYKEEYGLIESLVRPVDKYDKINERTETVLKQIGLADAADQLAETLAYGDKRRVEIGMVLATNPEIVLFDEPTAGMSVEETEETINLIQDVLSNQTLLLIEHDIDLVMELSDRITVLDRGKILSEGSPDEIAQDSEVKEAYLGGVLE